MTTNPDFRKSAEELRRLFVKFGVTIEMRHNKLIQDSTTQTKLDNDENAIVQRAADILRQVWEEGWKGGRDDAEVVANLGSEITKYMEDYERGYNQARMDLADKIKYLPLPEVKK